MDTCNLLCILELCVQTEGGCPPEEHNRCSHSWVCSSEGETVSDALTGSWAVQSLVGTGLLAWGGHGGSAGQGRAL